MLLLQRDWRKINLGPDKALGHEDQEITKLLLKESVRFRKYCNEILYLFAVNVIIRSNECKWLPGLSANKKLG